MWAVMAVLLGTVVGVVIVTIPDHVITDVVIAASL